MRPRSGRPPSAGIGSWLTRRAALLGVVLSAACTGLVTPPGEGGGRDNPPGDQDATCDVADAGVAEEAVGVAPVSATRLLRRVHLVLHGRPPLDEDVAALAAATTDAQSDAIIEAAIDDGLGSSDFYDRMVDFGHSWMRNGAFLNGAQGDAYMGNMSAHLGTCRDSTVHPGAFHLSAHPDGGGDRERCDEPDAPTREIEPWWAPGTRVTLVGDASSTTTEVIDDEGVRHDCGVVVEQYYDMMVPRGGCGCGPHATWCYPRTALESAARGDRYGQRRDMWDEPARLVAHLAWHDRPLSDLVLGNYTVATTEVRAWYLRFGRQTGLYNEALDSNETWFRPELDSGPRDPNHPEADDRGAWRELVVEELAPQLLSLSGGARSADPSRTLRWNPVDDGGPAPGLPVAGVLTMPGPNSSFPRERPRAARFIEIFSCRNFDPPPADQHFPPLGADIARSGQCMHCHVLMDPVAMSFRRWIFRGNYVPRPHIADLASLRVPTDLYEPALRHTHRRWFGSGASRWRGDWAGDTVLTPVSRDTIEANPAAMLYDTIPESYSIYGEHPDGTMGPLGFAKVLVSSGEFDSCAVRRIYERFVGRPLDPETEAGFIQALAARFHDGGRQVRPFVRELLMSPEFRRGW